MKKPVLALLSIILLTAGCSQRPAATTKIPLTSAHRGAATIAPENTMASVDSCIKYGVGNIECDVCISKDSVFYVLHDSTLDRTTNGTGRHLPMAVRRHRHTGCRLLVCAPICRTTGTTSYRPATQGQRARFKNHHRLPQRRSAPITGSDKGRRHAGKLQLHLQQGVSCQMLQKDGTRGKNPASLHQK